MERWLKASAVEAAPVEPAKAADRAAAVKAEMSKVWDATPDREAMLKHVEAWLAYGAAPVEVRGCMLREELHPIMVEVYQEKYPEDFAAPKAEGEVGLGGELEEPK
jgi:hypothetical protein